MVVNKVPEIKNPEVSTPLKNFVSKLLAPWNKKSFLVFSGVVLSLVLVFVLLILGYFAVGYKGKEQVNFLFLGESGPGHEGADLTDTLIFSSVSSKGTVFVSVPRDLWYQPWQTKINTVYYYGQEKGDGFVWTKKILEEITGQNIDYVVLIDFNVFQDLVDLVGGVDVLVDRSFDDFLYPIAGKENDLCNGDKEYKCRYEHLHFDAGLQHMDGQTSLKFVRSRNAEGEEGNDTARSARQQKVLLAIKAKILSPSFFLSYEKVQGLQKIIKERFKGDLPNDIALDLIKIFFNKESRQVSSFVLNSWKESDGLIYHPETHPSKQWVLLPKDSSWRQVHNFMDCLVYQEDKSLCSQTEKQLAPTP